MADKRSYLVPYRANPRVYRSLSAYLQGVARYAPPLTSGSLPSKLAKTAKKEQEEKKEKEKEKTWIEIVLLDEAGEPVPDQKYEIELPDGSKKQGTLDANGKAKVEELDPGRCKVSFPDLEASFFGPPGGWSLEEEEASVEAQPKPKSWIEITLLDESGLGVGGQRYVVESPDGLRKEGTLDGSGKAKVEDVEDGLCKVSFPDLDETAFADATSGSSEPAKSGG